MRWAVLDGSSVVVSIVDSPAKPDSSVMLSDGDGAAVGKVWTGCDFIAPRWTTYEFLNRFTVAELDACLEASLSDTITRRFLAYCEAAHEVVSDDPATVSGMDYLVSSGLLASSRRDEILAA